MFRDLHLDDEAQVVFSRKLGKVEIFGKGEHPEIFRVTLDPAKNPSAQYLRGTFDWHIDGCTDDIPIMATMLSAHAVAESRRRDRVRQLLRRLRDARRRREGAARRRAGRAHHRGVAAALQQRPLRPRRWSTGAGARPRSTRSCGGTARAASSLVLGATTDHVVGMDPDEGRALLDDLLDRATTPDRVYRHEWQVGDVVIWDNRGVLHRALPVRPDLTARHAPHDVRGRRAHPVSGGAQRHRHGRRRRASASPSASGWRPTASPSACSTATATPPTRRPPRSPRPAAPRWASTADVTDRAGIDAAVAAVGEALGAPTILVNNAGLDGFSPFLKTHPRARGTASSR